MRDFVVDFRLPFDALFVHHGANIRARNAREAVRIFRAAVPEARGCTASEGVVCLYGERWADWDASAGAECRPVGARPLVHLAPEEVDCDLAADEPLSRANPRAK